MENSGNFVKLSPNQETLHFCLLNIVKNIAKQSISKEESRREENKAKLIKRKERD